VTVPPVVGMTLSAAMMTLRAAHLFPVRGRPVCQRTVPRATVASQEPVAQTEVVLDSAVLLRMSRGRHCQR
jgi:beta-lactam-binding protein with PASTA domain